MDERMADASMLAAEVRARFPGAQVAQVRTLAPAAELPGKLQIGDLLIYAEAERDRARSTRETQLARANESDQKTDAERALLVSIAREQGRIAEAFGKIADLIVLVRDETDVRSAVARASRRRAEEAAAGVGVTSRASEQETAS